MNKLSLVIPMVGLGSRFKKEGYLDDKPFIRVGHDFMIERVIQVFCEFVEEIILVCREDTLTRYREQIDGLVRRYGVSVVIAQGLTQGASCSVLVARSVYRGKSILIADCDTFYEKSAIADFVKKIGENYPDYGLITFNSDSDRFSYIASDRDKVQIAEKEVISNKAISGVYYFKDSEVFNDAVVDCMIYGQKTKGEFYISQIMGNLLKKKGNLLVHQIEASERYGVGTPEELIDVLKRID